MPIPLQTWPITAPGLYETLIRLETEIMATLFCHEPGHIVSLDRTKWTAQVQPAFKRTLEDGTIIDRAVIVDVPIFSPGGGGAWIQFPIAVGDDCLLVYMDRDIGSWYIQGGVGVPPTRRMHHVSDAFALVGIKPQNATAPAMPSDLARIISTGGAEVDVRNDGLIAIKNMTTSLLTLLDGLIDVLKALTVQDGMTTLPLTAASIAALEAYKIQLAALLV